MAWIYLTLAVVCEVLWASSLKMTERFSQLWPSVFNLSFYAINVYCLATVLKTLPVAVAYSIWTGLGGVGVTVCAVIFFKESLEIFQIFSILLIVSGIIGLEATKPEDSIEVTNHEEKPASEQVR